MNLIADSREIFAQLADVDGTYGVATLVETHDAWIHSPAVQIEVSAAMRAQLARTPRPESVLRRIIRQRDALAALVIPTHHQAQQAG